MLDGATLTPLLLLLFRLIAHGEIFCLFHVDETCLKLYPWTIVHTTSPCNHVILNLLFHRYLLVEGSKLLYIVSSILLLEGPGTRTYVRSHYRISFRCPVHSPHKPANWHPNGSCKPRGPNRSTGARAHIRHILHVLLIGESRSMRTHFLKLTLRQSLIDGLIIYLEQPLQSSSSLSQ